MKIVHLCLSGPYNDNWGYQDNLLPLYHQKLGHDVTVIATNTMHGSKGPIIECDEGDYRLANGLRIIRISIKPFITKRLGNAYRYYHVYDLLNSLKPDYIMTHGLVSITALQAVKYKKTMNPQCVIVADTHTDYNNSPPKNTLKNRVFFLSLALLNRFCMRHYKRIFGVSPWRIKYANEVYGIPRNRMDLLPMGADIEIIAQNKQNEIRKSTRKKYDVDNNAFLVVSGGKLDEKKNIHNLIEALGELNIKCVKLIVFGSIADEYVEQFLSVIKKYSEVVIKIGFLDNKEICNLFTAADLAIFPGGHSVLWEQAIACGLPTVFKKWPDMEYLDLGGNTIFLDSADSQGIKATLEELVSDKTRFAKMKEVAKKKGYTAFSYLEIAKKSLQ